MKPLLDAFGREIRRERLRRALGFRDQLLTEKESDPPTGVVPPRPAVRQWKASGGGYVLDPE